MTYTHRYRKRYDTKVQNHEKLKWHSWSVSWTSEQGTNSFFLQQKNSTSNLFQLQSQIRCNGLIRSQQLFPQIQTLLPKISKPTITSTRKVPPLLWQTPFTELLRLQRGLLTKLRRSKHLENSANKWKMSTDYFFV